jgi:hypothetical protein
VAHEATTPQGPAGPCVSFLSGLLDVVRRPSFSFLAVASHRPQLRRATACAARMRHQPAASHLLPSSLRLHVHVHQTGGQLTVTAAACACSLSLSPPAGLQLPWAWLLGVLACSLSHTILSEVWNGLLYNGIIVLLHGGTLYRGEGPP